MAEVLSPQPDNHTSFYASKDSSLPISSYYSSPNLASNSMLNAGASYQLRSHASSTSLSSRTSTSDLSNLLSIASPPSSIGSSLEDKYTQELDDEEYPHFDAYDTRFIEHSVEREEQDEQDEQEAHEESSLTTISDSSVHTPTVVDDTAVKQQPSQHVDYLSHNWREEDVWSSWRHIVSHRRIYGQQSRFENAAWRTWMKNKYKLRTISPETLNWLKESDVTWLYGPLKPAQSHPISHDDEADSRISKNNSFILNKKPILKKRSMSEVMLQRSISQASLVQQAAASVQAQSRRTWPQEDVSALVSEPTSRDAPGSVCSTSSSGTETPSEGREKKHIRFDNTVEQCIAVEAKPEEYDEDDESDLEGRPSSSLSSNSSDEGLVMMRKPRRPGMYSRACSSKGSRSNSQSRKTIETLPSTTLKYRTDTPEISEQQQQTALARFGSRPRLSPSASQETLRPARPSKNFLLGTDEENDEDLEDETSWSFGSSNPRSSLGAAANSSDNLKRSALPHSHSSTEHFQHEDQGTSRQLQGLESEPGAYGSQGLRRTESGMFMPEDEDDVIATGLFGKISETVNTARDIAHVIWNVGWRK